MENMNIVNAEQQAPNTISATNSIFNVQALGQLTAFANLMADATIAVPDHLVGKPADCMAIVMQAMQWGMNPYAVAQKTFFVGGKLGYEAQLISAILSSSGAIRGRFHYEYGGNWENCIRSKDVTVKKMGSKGAYEKTERVRDWSDEDEDGLYIRAGAIIRGESEITWGEPLYLASVAIRNSPLWVTKPKQQILYLATKDWAKAYCPAAVMGFQDADDLSYRDEKVINPAPAQRVSLADINGDAVTTTHSAQESAANINGLADDFRDRIENAEDVDAAKALRADIETAKQMLGSALFTELKNKAVKRYYLVDARNKVEAAINSLPQPGEPEAAELFAKAEQTLAAAKRHLGDDLYERFSINLLDMKPEYVS
ncbi:RecT family recombinase [Superficieibacter sp. 1612_C1]|uniref:RecT family recombinase n=1 Tax=Superficieibacter sp. 1612_C1 TaxID=2780382 RepID=UPI00188368B2|nr:RecT family recombinase [Superficieibacter sp. 1612_C1]